ncbi:GNAT family N-acetyltransferase [Rhizobiaceae bacterium BDR2-2]|uniref:GNAT family N-acetyltransferase n=1 Tax=Ectorhizobium quercum TaxID=2965071 RepID=A0AAE3SYA2_9HYPH|nr:GNAT family N-acetyltransferase [Ectorhizobium quercum]MCX8999325.1 GNAT family N-acetyltransferase [Ectorhizobium quercum]
MSCSIRPAVPADIPAIQAIYEEAVLNGTASYEIVAPGIEEMRNRFLAITGNGYPYLAAVDDEGRLLGYAYASAFRTRPAYRWLVEDSIYIAADARGRGIGRLLLAALIERTTALGFRQMVAVIGGASPASIAVHAAAGFSMVGRIEGSGFKLDQWLDTVFMQLALGEGTTTPPDMTAYPAAGRDP